MYLGLVFSVLSFLVAVPSAVKIFNWATTMYKGSVELTSHMLYAFGFLGLFTIGGLTGLYLSSLATDIHLTATYFVVAHFHYVMVGGTAMGFLAGLHFWWPKMTGRMYNEVWGKVSAVLVFLGFNLTFLPQFVVGYLGMPRRYHFYPPEFQLWHVMSTGGAFVLGVGFLLPVFYLIHSLKHGEKAGSNPWRAVGLEWLTTSPPDTHNFHEVPVVTWEAYEYFQESHHGGDVGPSRFPFDDEAVHVSSDEEVHV
jgi:cytochrome c oxidase subunit 1